MDKISNGRTIGPAVAVLPQVNGAKKVGNQFRKLFRCGNWNGIYLRENNTEIDVIFNKNAHLLLCKVILNNKKPVSQASVDALKYGCYIEISDKKYRRENP